MSRLAARSLSWCEKPSRRTKSAQFIGSGAVRGDSRTANGGNPHLAKCGRLGNDAHGFPH
jgi:hypothetical protein